jgi:hypothetical protein
VTISIAPLTINPIRQRFIVLISTILTIILNGLCVFQYVEWKFALTSDVQPHTILDSWYVISFFWYVHFFIPVSYFIAITMSTVGFGDISPKTPLGRISVLLVIIVAIIILPSLVRSVLDTYQQQKGISSSFDNNNLISTLAGRGNYIPGNCPFVVICGNIQKFVTVADILSEFMHKVMSPFLFFDHR